MARYYATPTRESDPWSLPDIEAFYRTETANRADGWIDDDGRPYEAGWYYWYCLPGCLPDSDPYGPFASEQAAIDDAREQFGDDDA